MTVDEQASRMNMLVFFVLCASLKFGLAATNRLYLYNASDCTCPGQNITYECSAIGGFFTVWNGSITAGDCTITLLHSEFEAGTTNGFCDTGSNTATARGVRIENNTDCYISQLIVLATPDLDGRTIECCIDYGPMNGIIHIGTETLTLTRVPFLPPSNLQLIDVTPNELTFMWTPPQQQCPSLTFNITSENCGTCESASIQPTTVCSNFTLGTVCLLRVYSIICGNIVSLSPSRVISATLEVPEAPLIITCVPHYSETDGRLLRIETNFSVVEPFLISDGVDGSAINYTLSYTNNLGAVCSLGTVLPTSCDENVCTHVFEASTVSPFCSQISESGIFISVLATNKLGNGYANRIFKDGVNRLVKVLFNSSTLNFNCTFLNEPLDREKECRANLSYGDNCENDQGVYLGSINEGNTLITNAIEPLDDTTKYCYTVQARSGNKTVVVNGTFTLGLVISDSGDGPIIITNEIIATIVVLSILISIIITGALPLLTSLIIKYRQGANRQVITRFSCKKKIDNLSKVLKVFKDHKINIIGFNAYCEPQQQHRKEVHLHLRLNRKDKKTLERILAPSSPEFLDNDVLSVGEEIYTTVILSLKDKLGALWTSLNAIEDDKIKSLKLEGVNTWSTTSDEYKDIFVSCLCPHRIRMQNISDKLQSKGVGARNANYEFSPAKEYIVSISIRKEFSMLIHALKIFGDLNISVVGLDEDYSKHQKNTKVENRNYYVECKIESSESAVSRKLNTFGAKHCVKTTGNGTQCTFEFTVRDEIGSLAAVLQGFVRLDPEIEIISVNHGRSNQESATDDKEYRHILITCNFGKIKVEKEFLEDLEVTGYVDNPTIRDIDHTQRKLEFDIRHTPGALVVALKVLAKYDINMTKIENDDKPLKRPYRLHRVHFISTESQKHQLISKLEEIGSEPRLIDDQEVQQLETRV